MAISAVVRGKVDEEGDFTVEGRLLSDYVNLLPASQKLSLEIGNQELKITTEDSSSAIKGLPAEDFPVIPEVEKKNPLLLSSSILKNAINRVAFSASPDDSRPELNGVLFKVDGDYLYVVATDSYRLAERRVALKNKATENLKVIIPIRPLQELNRILEDSDAEVKIYITDNQVLFEFDEIQLISRLVDGAYPDYEQIIPANSITRATFNTSELVTVIKRASLFSQTKVNDIKIDCHVAKQELTVSSTNAQKGENTTNLRVQLEGDDNSIIFNFRYLLDGLNALNAKEAQLQIIDFNNPAIIRPQGDNDYLYLVMPIKS
jgi:DNA polymerase-3 subunit beta